MGACGDFESMDSSAYYNHIREKATELKDKVAEKAAKTVFEDARSVQTQVQMTANQEATSEAQDAGQPTPAWPVPLGPDHGYQYLNSHYKDMVDRYQADYQINLLTFSAEDKGNAETQLKETHLTWIVEIFEQCRTFPDPKDADPIIQRYESLAGTGDLADISFSGNTEDPIAVREGTATGQGKFGDPAFFYTAAMMDSVEYWDSPIANGFRNQFVPRIPSAADNQKGAIRTLHNLLATNQGVMTWARRDIDALVHDGITAVEHFDDCKSGDDGLTVTLGIIAGVATIVAGIATIPATGGLSAAAIAGGATIVAGAATAGQTIAGIDEAKKDKDLGGDTLDDVLENITHYANDTFGKLDEFNTALANEGFGQVEKLMDSSPVLFKAPAPSSDFLGATPENIRDVTDEGDQD